MKILHITDSHGTVKGPEGRKDVYYASFLRKLYEVGKVAKVIDADMIIHTGDLFHTARVSNKFAGQTSELIKAIGKPFYVVPGNHDIEGYTIDTIDQTTLGLLSKAGVVTLLDREHPINIIASQGNEEYTISISGQEYYAHIDEGNPQDFEMQQDESDLNILCIHGYIADTPQHPNIKCTMVQDIVTDADIILCGHYHRQFAWEGQDVSIYNPGSMMRVEQTEYNKTHIPQFGILDISLDNQGVVQYDYQFHNFHALPSTTVFDYNSKYQAQAHEITLEGFKTSIANTISSINVNGTTIPQILYLTAHKANVDNKVYNRAEQAYQQALQNAPDIFEVQDGYIPLRFRKTIKEVIIENFQSHEHTHIKFHDRLNIIIGESNNGKTSILRAIMWVIDNQPLGNDFIMAGKTECKVRVVFNNDSWIERGRTTKDTGYYKTFDGVSKSATYRGFTNAVPVEIANIHQMPKIQITKDYETHLNVMTQLDEPFLLTQSPANKAAAIGRITGTHIVDAAIKELNRENKTKSTLINNNSKHIDEEKLALSKLPNVDALHKVAIAFDSLVKYGEQLFSRINTVNGQYTVINDTSLQIEQQRNAIDTQRNILQIQPVVSFTWKLLDKITTIYNQFVEIQRIKQEIENCKQQVIKQRSVASLSNMVDTAISHMNTFKILYGYQKEYTMISKESTESKQSSIVNQSLSKHLRTIINFIESKLVWCNRLQDIANLSTSLSYDINIQKRTCSGWLKQASATKKQIAETISLKNNFILNNRICPCCGNPISTEQDVQHISFFMEGFNHG